MAGIDIALRNGEQAGQTRLGGQKVIAIRIKSVGIQRKTDGEQLLVRLQQKAEIHLGCDGARHRLDFGKKPRVMAQPLIGKVVLQALKANAGPKGNV